jgi:hypothetical protein
MENTKETQPLLQQIYSMSEKELQCMINDTMNEIGENFYKIKPLNRKISKSLRENFYKNENNILHLNTNFEDIEEFEYEVDEFSYYFKVIKEKIAKARLMKAILLQKQTLNNNYDCNIKM